MKPSNDREAITLILEGLAKVGVEATAVNNDSWNPEEVFHPANIEETVAEATAADEAVVYFTLPSGGQGWIYFVLGNDPEEVACNYTVNLSEFIDPITDPWWNR